MKKQTIKKVVTSALVANLMLGSVITALPIQGAAAENATTGNSAEKKLLTNLKSTQNILKNTNFESTNTGMTDWNPVENANVRPYGTKDSNGWFSFDSGKIGVRPIGNGSVELYGRADSTFGVSQIINTIPGQTYTISYDYNTTKYTTKQFAVGTSTATQFNAKDVATGAEIKEGSTSSGWNAGSVYYPIVANRVGLSGTFTSTFVATGKTTKIYIGSLISSQDKSNEMYQTISNVQVLGESTAQLEAPTLQPVKNQDPKITGSLNGSIDTLQTVQIYKNDIYVGTATVSGRNFEMAVSPSNVGDVYKAYAVDIWDVKSNPATQTVTASAIATPTIARLTDQSTTASGTGEPGSVLTLKIGDATYTTDVAADGTWSKTITKPKAGLVAEATSVKAGITSDKATTTVVDVTAPDAPVLGTVTDKDTHVKGTGEAGTTVKVKLPNNTERTGTVDANGEFDVVIPAQAKDAVITATLTDAAGNVSTAGTTTVVHAAPSAPVLDTVTDKSTKVTGTGDIGNTVTIKITDNGVSISYTGTVDDFGEFSIPIDTPKAGATVDAIAKDSTNTLSPKTSTVVKDVTAPDAPTVNPVIDTATTITGSGEANCDVKVTLPSGGVLTGRTNDAGVFSITMPAAQTAGREIKVTLTDAAGNESNPTTITVQPSTISAPTINGVTTDDLFVTGTGIKGATVTVTIAGVDYTGTVDDNDNYSIAILKQAVGTIISAKQTLASKTSASVTTTVTQGSIVAPTIGAVTTDDTTVKGTGIPGATVTVTVGGQDKTATVGQNGNYSVTISKQAVGTIITAKQTLNGQTSSSVNTTVTQGALEVPVIDSVTSDDILVTGTGIKGAVVTLTIAGHDYTGLVEDNGTYSITIVKQPAGTEILAKQEINGKSSADATATVTQGAVTPPTVNPVTTDDTVVTGTGMKGATVKVTLGSIDYTGTVDNNGNYSIPILKQPFGTVITATETLNGKTSTATIATVTQGTVAAPTINSLTTEDTIARGTGITGAVVTITIGSSTYTGTVTNGEYAITIPKQAAGTVVNAKQTLNDKASSSVSTTVTQGSIAAPTVSAVTTDDTLVKGTGIAGATVTVTIGSTPYTGTVAANGAYSITIPKQAFGTAITVKQALDGKTSTNASTTVTQGAVATPTIGAVTTDDTLVKGTGIAGATVTITIGSSPYTGTVAANGSYSITIPKQAAGTVISAKQTLNGKTSSAVNTTVTSTQTTLTADSFTVGVDSYIKGTYTGSVAKIAIEVNGTLQQKITVASSPYQYYAKGKVTAATDQVYVISYNANGDQLKRVKVDVKRPTAGTLTPDTFYIGTDNYVTGTLTGDISKFSLIINGVETTKIDVTTAPTFRYYANNLIRSLTDIVTVNGYDSTGKLLDSKPVTVGQDRGNPGTIATVAPFKLGKDSYVTGTYTGDIAKVELQVNDVTLQRINVAADGTIKYYAKGKINNTTDVVKLVGYNTAGVAVSTKLVTISNSDGSITANPYVIGTDSYVKGTFTGDVAKISLTVNGDKKTTISAPTPGPNYQYYAKSLITNATDIVVVTAYDATGGILDTKTVAVSKPTVVTRGTVTPSAYKIGTNTYVDGTYTGDVAKVALEINGVLNAPIPATGNTIHYYAGSLISDKNDVVNVIVYDAAGKQLDKKQVTITAPEGTVTPNTLKTTDGYLTGSATGDVAKVTLSVNGVKQASITVVQADGTYRYYVKPLALTPTDIVKVIGLDSRGNEITTADVTITN
ncbi:immunoglobulin-like domain-containing protein [Listeria booriae]|uniref:immunoglobulin-like domain-containing protein n=1 Tax=Listeria booriae TaxID=1552123 RepID=UPI0016267C1F|nr:immunoglobulin-like domain-containing protein [Listeria booriae]MBC1359303.1 hypothetical protein [Listeria booriae]